MTIRRRFRALLWCALLSGAATSTALAQRNNDAGFIDENSVPSGNAVGAYFAAVVLGGVAIASVLRSSRRGWSE